MKNRPHPTPLKAIRMKCLDCCGHVASEVRKCPFDGKQNAQCPLYIFRLGYRIKAINKKYKNDKEN